MRRALLLPLLLLLLAAAAKPGIRAVDFRTFAYETRSGTIDLREGKGVVVDGEPYADVTALDVQYARLIPGQGEQALVHIHFRYRKEQALFSELQIFTMEQGAPKLVRQFIGGCCGDENILEVKPLRGGDLRIVRHAKGNRSSGTDRTVYRWRDGEFREVSSTFSPD
jgi:hypothetical protein